MRARLPRRLNPLNPLSTVVGALALVAAVAVVAPAPASAATTAVDAVTFLRNDTGEHTFVAGRTDQHVGAYAQGSALVVGGEQDYPTGVTHFSGQVQITPPTGETQLVAGRTYDTLTTPDATHAGLVTFSTCPQSSVSGQMTVDAVSYPDASAVVPSTLALSWSQACNDGPVSGVVRWHSTEPFTAVEVAGTDVGTAVVDQTVTSTITYTNVGTAPITPTGATIDPSSPDAKDWSVPSSGCTSALQPGQACTLTVALTPSTSYTANGDTVSEATVLVQDDSPQGVRARPLTGRVQDVGTPTVQVLPFVGETLLSWQPGPGRAPSGYRVLKDGQQVQPESFDPAAALPATTTSWVDLLGWTGHTYQVAAVPAAGLLGDPALSAPVPTGTAESELVLIGTPADGTSRALMAGSLPAQATIATDRSGVIDPGVGLDYQGHVVYAKETSSGPQVWVAGRGPETLAQCASCTSPITPGRDPAYGPSGTVDQIAVISPAGYLAVTGAQNLSFPAVAHALQPAWMPDASGLVVADSAGGGLRRVTLADSVSTVAGTTGARHPSVSPTADRIAFLLPGATAAATQLRLVPLAGGTASTLLTGDLRSVVWRPDGSALVVTERTGGGSVVVSVDPGTGVVTPLLAVKDALDAAVLRSTDTTAPNLSLSVPALTTARPVVRITATDDTRFAAGLSYTCSLDGAAATACGPSSWTGTVSSGAHTLTVTASDGQHSSSASASFTADAAAPTVAVTGPTAGTVTTTSAVFTWSGKDTGAGIASYDARYRAASYTASGFSSYVYPGYWQHLTATAARLSLAAGSEYCVSVRAHDKAGNVGAWSPERCVARPVDDRALYVLGGSWARGTSSADYSGTYSRSGYGARLALASAHTSRVVVVATTCPTCGAVEVWVGSTRLGVVGTWSSTTRHQVQLAVPVARGVLTGTLVLRASTAGKLAYVDGVSLRRT